MDGMNNNQGYPEQKPGPDPNQMNEQNTNQGNTNAEAGNTYWEAQNAGENPTPAQGTERPETPAQFYQNYQQQMGGDPYGMPQMQQPVEPPKKKSHKSLITAIIVVIVVLSLAGTAFAFKDKIINALSMSTKSPEEYYATVEQQAINSSIDKMMADMKAYDFSKGMAYDISADLTYDKDTVSSILQSSAGMTIEDLESYIGISLDSLGFDMTVALEDSNIYEEIGLRLNQIDIITAEILIDSVKQQLLMRLPELSQAYLSQSLDMSYYGMGSLDFEAYLSQLEDLGSDKTADFLKRYTKIITDNIKDVELSKNEELKVDDLSIKCNMLTVTIDEETILDIASEVLKEAKDDEYIIDLLSMFNVTEDQYQEAIEEAEAELESAVDNSNDGNQIIMDVYVDGKGKIIGRTIQVEAYEETVATLGYALVSEGSQEEYEFFVEDEYGTTLLSIAGSHTMKDGAYTGKATLDIDAESAGYGSYSFDLEYEDARYEMKDNKAYYYGKYTLSSLVMMGMEVALEYDVEDDVQNTKLSLNMGNTPVVSLDMSTEYLKDFKFPNPSSDAEVYDALMESDQYLATMNIDQFVADLSDKLGVDLQSLIDYFMPYY